jgi:hypothetical protein
VYSNTSLIHKVNHRAGWNNNAPQSCCKLAGARELI